MPPRKISSGETGATGWNSPKVDKTALGKYTWKEVAQHNNEQSAWVIIDGDVYDITDFLDKHPGGKEMLLLSAGRDCTDLFRQYHWWQPDTPRKYLEAYKIGKQVGETEFPVYTDDTKGFYDTVSKRVRKYFEERNLHPKDPLPGTYRAIVFMAIAYVLYGIMHDMFFTLPLWLKIVPAIAYGLFQALPLMHVMHDASHAAIGPNETYWKFFGRLTMDLFAGGCMMSWHHQHTVGHHVYTNVFNADPDIPYDESDVRYLSHTEQKWKPMYAYQHIYLPIVYGVLAIRNRVMDIVETWVAETSGPIRVNLYNSPWYRMVLTKIFWLGWRVALPIFYLNVPVSHVLVCFLFAELMTGYYLAWNFEVSHIVDTVIFPEKKIVKEDGEDVVKHIIPHSWAESQVLTGVGYGHDSWWTTLWTGALNFQIEHHLFPGISQYHYPGIAPIVKDACKEFGIRYHYEPGFWAAWQAHVRFLRTLSEEGKKYHLD